MLRAGSKIVLALALVAGCGLIAREILERVEARATAEQAPSSARRPAPVEVARVERGPITLRRTFSGALEARSRFVVAPKVSGRIERVAVDIADAVQRNQTVVWLDDDEIEQAVAQAQAELEVSRANEVEAVSALEISARELARIESLQERGVTSESQYDAARADWLGKQARLAVTRAQVTRSEAVLEAVRIRLSYTQVAASWTDADDEERIVAERYVDEGETVGANTPLLSIVAVDPIEGIVFAPERDYGSLHAGQPVEVTTQAFPGERFTGRVERIAPVFRESTRQARVELTLPNADRRLKPGMFMRATIELARVEDALIVPEAALTERADQPGLFVLAPDGQSVRWCPVVLGLREAGRVQVEGAEFGALVVTLGQELLDDGAAILVSGEGGAAALQAAGPGARE